MPFSLSVNAVNDVQGRAHAPWAFTILVSSIIYLPFWNFCPIFCSLGSELQVELQVKLHMLSFKNKICLPLSSKSISKHKYIFFSRMPCKKKTRSSSYMVGAPLLFDIDNSWTESSRLLISYETDLRESLSPLVFMCQMEGPQWVFESVAQLL